MKREDAEEFTQSLGQIVGGSWRQIALAKRLGVPKALGLSVENWVNQRLGGYVKYAASDRMPGVLELKAEGLNNVEIAESFGVDETTVRRDLKRSAFAELPAVQQLDFAQTYSANAELTRPRSPPPPVGQFSVILADPPWRYEFSPTDSRQVENQYQTMEIADICEIGRSMPFAADSVLFLWATAPKLPEAMRTIDAWAFSYVTHAVWDKEIIGMGYWFRGQHELLLVATRGDFPPPAEGLRVPSVIHGRRSRHSEKPEAAYRLIEAAYPELGEAQRLEMFARAKRDGWTPWGDQLTEAAA